MRNAVIIYAGELTENYMVGYIQLNLLTILQVAKLGSKHSLLAVLLLGHSLAMGIFSHILIVFVLIKPSLHHHDHHGLSPFNLYQVIIDLYVEEMTLSDGGNLREIVLSQLSQFQSSTEGFRIVKFVKSRPTNIDGVTYFLLAFAKCENFVILNNHIEENYYNETFSITVSLESCPRKNYVGQLMYVLPQTLTDHMIQLFSDLIRIDKNFKNWNSINLFFDEFSEPLVNNMLSTTNNKIRHMKMNALFRLHKHVAGAPDGNLAESLSGMDSENKYDNNFVMFLDFGLANIIIQEILELNRNNNGDCDYFALHSIWIIIITKPLKADEDVRKIFNNGLNNLAVVLPDFTLDSVALQRSGVDCISASMEKTISHFASEIHSHNAGSLIPILLNEEEDEEHKRVILESRQCFNNVTSWDVFSSVTMTGVSSIRKINWVPGLGFNSALDGVFLNRKLMKTFVIKALISNDPPWLIIKGNCNTSNNHSTSGVALEIMLEMERRLGFKLELVCLSKYTNPKSNSSTHEWDTISSLLQRKLVDIHLGGTTITQQRKQEVDFMTPFHLESVIIVSGKPRYKTHLTLLTDTFTVDVWIYLLCLAVAVVLSLTFIRVITEKHCKTKKQIQLNITNSYMIMIGILLQQSVNVLPTSASSGVLLLTWLVTTFVIGGLYSGALVSFMTVPRYTNEIKSLSNLLEEQGMTYGIDKRTLFNTGILESNDTQLLYVAKSAILHNEITAKILQSVKKRQHALIKAETAARMALYNTVEDKKYKLFVIGDPLLHDELSFPIPKYHPLKNILNKELQQLLSSGFIDKWKREYLPAQSFKFVMPTTNIKFAKDGSYKFTFQKCEGALLMLASGCGVAFICFVLENIISWKCLKKMLHKTARNKST